MPQSTVKYILTEFILKEPDISELKNAFYENNKVKISMLRLDEIHPIISGNKLFKLSFFLEEALNSAHKKVITFGGAYSNHLAATAIACIKSGLQCIGIVRGEMPALFSPTLLFCKENGMQLVFISRESYKRKGEKEFINGLKNEYGEHVLIPEGGFSIKGKEGASLICNYISDKNFTHICLPVGTATTFAGISEGNKGKSELIGFNVLKGINDVNKRFSELKVNPEEKYSITNDYHFGGYAKRRNELISFMNEFYKRHQIPLDFVYTAKMMFGVDDLVRKKYFPPGSEILCIHTGGLQGNKSLPMGTLIY